MCLRKAIIKKQFHFCKTATKLPNNLFNPTIPIAIGTGSDNEQCVPITEETVFILDRFFVGFYC